MTGSPDSHIDVAANDDLDPWDAHGGAPTVAAQADGLSTAALSASEHRLLERLGAALVGKWPDLSMPLRRALYESAVRGEPTCDLSALKRRMARFLHHHKSRDGPAA